MSSHLMDDTNVKGRNDLSFEDESGRQAGSAGQYA